MKNLLIIYPHWHPANLAGVHRPRLIGNFLPELGWQPIVLTVEAEYFEEEPDPHFKKTFRDHYEVHRVKAIKAGKPRLIGDIGLRAFRQLYKKAKDIIATQNIDFIWIPIPSFYTALLGRLLYDKTEIPYGIDYIDPWVRDITNQSNLRAKLSQFVARNLEPFAVRKASLISGVSKAYYWPVIERNFKTPPVNVGMPYGFDPQDHDVRLDNLNYLWDNMPQSKPWIYAGAFLPNSHLFLESLFHSISELKKDGQWDNDIHLFFLGTGPYPAKRITSYARDYGLEDIVTEQRQRYPFLQILNFLSDAHRVMLLGSTEKHYTASKTFQCLLSQRPVLAMLHQESSAVDVMEKTEADGFLVCYQDGDQKKELVQKLKPLLIRIQTQVDWQVNTQPLQKYSAKNSAVALTEAMEEVLSLKK